MDPEAGPETVPAVVHDPCVFVPGRDGDAAGLLGRLVGGPRIDAQGAQDRERPAGR